MHIVGTSMQPTLLDGDAVVARRIDHPEQPAPGDIVIIDGPKGFIVGRLTRFSSGSIFLEKDNKIDYPSEIEFAGAYVVGLVIRAEPRAVHPARPTCNMQLGLDLMGDALPAGFGYFRDETVELISSAFWIPETERSEDGRLPMGCFRAYPRRPLTSLGIRPPMTVVLEEVRDTRIGDRIVFKAADGTVDAGVLGRSGRAWTYRDLEGRPISPSNSTTKHIAMIRSITT